MSVRFPYSPAKMPPVPAVILDLCDPSGRVVISPVSAHLDTAADWSVVPLPLIQQLGVTPIGKVQGKGFGGVYATCDVYRVRFVIASVGDFTLRVVGHSDESVVLVGRDVLNLLRVTFDGPNQVAEFH